MSTANKENVVERIELELEKEDLNLTLDELIQKKKIKKNGALFLIYKDIPRNTLDYYYNKDGIVEFHKLINDIPIKELKEYGYDIKNNITIEFYNGGLGSSGGFDFFDLLEQIELFFSQNPIIYDTFKFIAKEIIFRSIVKILIKLKDKCNPFILQHAIYHKKEYTEDDIIYQFRLNEIDDDYENQKAAVEIILEFYGFEYNKKKNKWILNEEKMRK